MSNDWLLRQLEDATRAIASFVLGKKVDVHEVVDEEGLFQSENFLRYQLKKRVLEGEINEAENLLFETIEPDPRPEYWPVALAFYEDLLAMPEAQLAACNFSQEEIAQGIQQLRNLYKLAVEHGAPQGGEAEHGADIAHKSELDCHEEEPGAGENGF